MNNVFVTGFSLASGIGCHVDEFSRALAEGASGICKVPQVGPEFPVNAVGLIQGLPGAIISHELVLQHLLRELLSSSGLKPQEQIDGIVFSLSWSREDMFANAATRPLTASVSRELLGSTLSPALFSLPQPSEWISISEACVTGTTAIGMAAQRIRLGRWRRALVIVSDLATSPMDLITFHQLRALSSRAVDAARASCPFSKDRDGFVKSQGAGAILLVGEDHLSPESKVLGRVAGFAQTGDGWMPTEGRPDCRGATAAMLNAMKSAGLEEGQLDCISAHGTSTQLNDLLETRAIKAAFPNRASKVPVTALKSQLGHAAHAAGMLQAIAALIMLNQQFIAPTINYREPDPDCDLDYVPNVLRRQAIENVLCNSFAFGGLNASLLLQRAGRA
ncbi:MAG: beta-ketoacyl-[acyl-carrier-protein] synthase family protein [Bdellovibrionota bacterium]